MYKKVSTDLRFVDRELAVLDFWRQRDIARKVLQRNPEGKTFTLYDGPPTANGKPHIGHILTRAIKDVIPRYRRMQGEHVEFKAGWDTHGLPVELEVEKALKINGKPEIEAYGLEPFIQQCKQSVWKYKDEWEQISERVAYSADMEAPYVTYENPYIESEWWALKKIWEKDLLYEGYKIVPYCPRCGTSLASHEVAQGYKDVKETSVFVRFAVEGEENTWFAAWTTTPWTLPSNVALCVNPVSDYALVEATAGSVATLKLDGAQAGKYWVAKELVASLFGEEATILTTCVGQDLVGKHYLPLFPYALDIIKKSGKDAYYVTSDDYVTLSDGTGIVHQAPAFGEDDARVGRRYDLPFVQLVKEDGTMDEAVTDFAGIFCKEADQGIIRKMAEEKSLLAAVPFEHSYPHCWRCDTPLIYYARHSWFIAMSQLREELVRNNRTVNWIPENIREGRFGNFIANNVDWGLSRQRYWGTPLPVWRCSSCQKLHVIGSIEELKSMSPDCPEEIELHKPYIDRVHLTCPHCQGEMSRVSEVIDCWFDSGAMPFAQYHYPFENRERFEEHYPARFISEAQDQTRGWFYSLMAISTLIFDRSPFENVIVLGLVQDKDGIKMSKHKGNVISPKEAIDRHGADAVRWYFYSGSQPWLPSRFSFDSVAEGQRRFMATLWNSYAFYILYADLDQFSPVGKSLEKAQLSQMDRWILARLQTLVATVTEGMEKYDITGSARLIQDFVDELSNWYVRRSRSRFWASGMVEDKEAAFLTLYTVLETLTRLCAPFVPFITEDMYQNLVRTVNPAATESVHLCDYPKVNKALVDPELEADMEEVLRLVRLGRAARNEANIKTRQPLSELLVVSPERLEENLLSLVADELNVKSIRYLEEGGDLIDHRFKPQLRTLGRRFGKRLPALTEAMKSMDSAKAWKELQEEGAITLLLDGVEERLANEDLLVETVQKENLATQQEGNVTVALQLQLTPALIDEGLVREVISKVQTMRRESDFEVTDRIVIYYDTDETLARIFRDFAEEIQKETLALRLEAKPLVGAKTWSINGHDTQLALERSNA